jgi:Na+-driven multidrug efflux pump
MRILAVATVVVLALLSGASVAVGADVGANDDSAKFS